MKQVFNVGGRIAVLEVPAPACGDGEVLVQSRFSVISAGTERASLGQGSGGALSLLSRVKKNPELVRKALEMARAEGLGQTVRAARGQAAGLSPLGYSSSGVVLRVGGNITDIAVGDRVACAGAGHASHAEVVAVPRNLACRVPEDVAHEEAAYSTLGAIAMQGVRRAQVRLGDGVVVIGLGLLGQLTCQLLAASGASVTGIDPIEERVQLAKELGAGAAFAAGEDVESQVLARTDGIGADSAIICADTPSSEPVQQAMRVVRKKGRVVVVGAVGMELERSPFYEKELDFLISSSYGPGRYDVLYEEKGLDYPVAFVRWTENRNMQEFLNLVARGKVDVERLTDRIFPIEEAEQGYDAIRSDEKRPVGVLLQYPAAPTAVPPQKMPLKSSESVPGQIRVAVVGAGSFARAHHLPNLKRIPSYHLRALVTKTGGNARRMGEEYGAQYCSTDYHDVLQDTDVDMVLIGTRHDMHAPLVQEAARSGKHIFVEKPIAMTRKECREVYQTVNENAVSLVVGFNRRFSPLGQRAKRIAEKRHGPLVAVYRVNSAGMKPEHWINDPVEGGGAILGEGCHFFDFVSWLVGAEPLRLYAEMISANDTSVVDANNVVSSLRFTDGSVASVVYSTGGHHDFPKERVELFLDGGVLAIDDFRTLAVTGLSGKAMTLARTEKGQFELLCEFGKVLKGESQSQDVPGVLDGVRATLCSLAVMEAVRSGEVQEFRYPW